MGRILQTNSAQVMGMQVTYPAMAHPVLAHAPEFHGQPAQPPPDSNGNDSAVESEVPTLSPELETTAVTEVNTFASEPLQMAALPDGLGESLFTILVSVPWVLMALRMQLDS